MSDVFAAAEGPKRRPGTPEFARRNRELIAERTGWPEGALAECLRLEEDCPGYSVAWFHAQKSPTPVFRREAGFYAWIAGDQPGHMGADGYHKRHEWYGATIEKLRAQLGC